MKTIETFMALPMETRVEIVKSVAFGSEEGWGIVLRDHPQVWKEHITSIISSIQASLASIDKTSPPPWAHPAKSVLRRLGDSLGEAKTTIAFHSARGSYRNAIVQHRAAVQAGARPGDANAALWSMLD